MINNIKYYITRNTVPYINLAVEEYLLNNVLDGECILFLWQNKHTVVIGKNQNAMRECKVEKLESDGGYLVRRLSGGGAVFHDLGNLNFTFLTKKGDYDVNKQLEVILRAVGKLGINAEKTGRNDIEICGKKFSGNAFYKSGEKCYHHGTIMVDVEKEMLSKYLNASVEKLASKGVKSVKSRVVNLAECTAGVTVEVVKEKLVEVFGEVYGLMPKEILDEAFDRKEIEKLTAKFSDWNWCFGRLASFGYEISKRFGWGEIQLHLDVKEGKIKDVEVYTDAMDTQFFADIPCVLKGLPFSWAVLAAAIDKIEKSDLVSMSMVEDIKELLLHGGEGNGR